MMKGSLNGMTIYNCDVETSFAGEFRVEGQGRGGGGFRRYSLSCAYKHVMI